jgi:hypothetical protein
MHSLRILAVGCVAALVLTACGSSAKNGDGDTTTTVPVTVDAAKAPPKALFLTNGNAMCGSFQAQIDHIRRSMPDDASAEKIKQDEETLVLPVQREILANLRGYPPPTGDAETLNAIWVQADEALNADEPDFTAVNAALKAYGFKQCAFQTNPTLVSR